MKKIRNFLNKNIGVAKGLTSVVFYIYKCTIELSMISYSLCAIAISVIIQCINAYKIHHMRSEC